MRPVRIRGVRRAVRPSRLPVGERRVRVHRAAGAIVLCRRLADAARLAPRAHRPALRAAAPERRGAGQAVRRSPPNGAIVQPDARVRDHAARVAQGSGCGAAGPLPIHCQTGDCLVGSLARRPTMTAIVTSPVSTNHHATDAAAMDALRALLESAGFTEEAVCRRTGVASIYDFTSIREGRAPADAGDALDILIRLFLDGELLDRALIVQHLPANAVRAVESLGLLGGPAGDASKQFATVLLYPTQGLWLISDLPVSAAGSANPLPSDAVYPAITENTHDFISSLPRTRCERFLEMCGGTGIAALMA